MEKGDVEELHDFLTENFFEQPFLTEESCFNIVGIVAPAVQRLTVGMRATVGVGY